MSDEQQIWEATCEKIGVWKRGRYFCPEHCHVSDREMTRCVDRKEYPAPTIGDAEATQGLMMYVLNHRIIVEFDGDECYLMTRDRKDKVHGSGRKWYLALADAINKVRP